MLCPSIVSIPITPRSTPKLGLMLIPFIMDVIGNKMGLDKVLALNVSGSKLFNDNVESCVQEYFQANSGLGIAPDYIWRDDQKENIYWINILFQQLVADGYVFRDERLILRCPCRVVETLALADNISNTRRLYERVGNVVHCKICGGAILQEKDNVYLFQVPDLLIDWHITPVFTKMEIVNLAKKFAGVQLLISRTRPSAIPLWTGKEYIFLDVDFGWQLFLPILSRLGHKPEVFIGSQKNLFGCYLSMLLSYLIDKTTPELIVPGYCVTKTMEDKFITDSFLEWNESSARIFLACHSTFRKKEIGFTASLLPLIKRILRKPHVRVLCQKRLSLSEAINQCDGSVVRKLLATDKYEHEIFSGMIR